MTSPKQLPVSVKSKGGLCHALSGGKGLAEADYTWVQCDLCNKWRELPKGHQVGRLRPCLWRQDLGHMHLAHVLECVIINIMILWLQQLSCAVLLHGSWMLPSSALLAHIICKDHEHKLLQSGGATGCAVAQCLLVPVCDMHTYTHTYICILVGLRGLVKYV